jgi:hypothetical protein
MEAWILHIKIKSKDNITDKYTAWASEKLAQKAAADFILDNERRLMLPYTLMEAAKSLAAIEDKIDLAINLINKYSTLSKKDEFATYNEYEIKIIPTNFLGSAFE